MEPATFTFEFHEHYPIKQRRFWLELFAGREA